VVQVHLLLRVAKEVGDVSSILRTRNEFLTTYNLSDDMIMHDVHYKTFRHKKRKTLEKHSPRTNVFEAIVRHPHSLRSGSEAFI